MIVPKIPYHFLERSIDFQRNFEDHTNVCNHFPSIFELHYRRSLEKIWTSLDYMYTPTNLSLVNKRDERNEWYLIHFWNHCDFLCAKSVEIIVIYWIFSKKVTLSFHIFSSTTTDGPTSHRQGKQDATVTNTSPTRSTEPSAEDQDFLLVDRRRVLCSSISIFLLLVNGKRRLRKCTL